MYNLAVKNFSQNKILGRWEYDINNDEIILSEGASQIYYNEYCNKRIAVDEFFRILSPKSSQCLSDVLTGADYQEIAFLQQIYCSDGTCKKAVVIILERAGVGKNKQALCIDVTKIL